MRHQWPYRLATPLRVYLINTGLSKHKISDYKRDYIVKLTLKEFLIPREQFSQTVYEENGQKDYGEYNVEIVKKITLGSTALTLGKSVRPSQGSKDSISNNAPNVKGVTWAQALEGVVDNSGAYLPEVKVYNQNQESPRGMVEIDEQAHEADDMIIM